METSLELSRWRETPRGVGYRRRTMVTTGLRQLLRTRFFRILLTLAWIGGAAIAIAGFLFSQTVSTGGWLDSLTLPARFKAVTTIVGAYIALYPDVVVGGFFTYTFWLHSFLGLGLSLFALTALVPRLVTQDRASNAITAYLSRPLTTFDYLLGKLGTIAGVLALVWTGPLIFGWLLSMMLSPSRDFIYYSFSPLLRALLFNAIGLVALAAISLGVSAINRSSRNTIITWIGLWLVAGTLAKAPGAPDLLKRASFTHDLSEIRLQVFHLDEALVTAATDLPFLNQAFADGLKRASDRELPEDVAGSVVGLAVFIVASSAIFFRKLRSE